MTHYSIPGTLCLHKEQNSGAYLDKDFWPNFYEDVEEFKNNLIDKVENNVPYTVLRVSHSEFIALRAGFTGAPQGGNFKGRHSANDTVSPELFELMLNTIHNADRVSTQIGYDFLQWMNEVNNYSESRDKWMIRPLNQIVDIPMDVIYALLANKWFFKTFKNKIGIIGAGPKVEAIRELMKYPQYREYIGCDYFTDYISIPQRQALDSDVDEVVERELKNATGKVFLLGAGVSKLKFYDKLKKSHNAVYIDVGHGIDMIAGHGDKYRPYCGNWVNYRVANKNTFGKVDEMGSAESRGKYVNLYDVEELKKEDFEKYKSFLKSDFTNENFCKLIDSEFYNFFVVRDGENIVGSVTILLEQKLTHSGCMVSHVENLEVSETYRRLGVGNALFEHCRLFAKENGCYRLNLSCKEELCNFYKLKDRQINMMEYYPECMK